MTKKIIANNSNKKGGSSGMAAMKTPLADMTDDELDAEREAVVSQWPNIDTAMADLMKGFTPHTKRLEAIAAEIERRKPKETAEALCAEFAALIDTHLNETYLSTLIEQTVKSIRIVHRMMEYDDDPVSVKTMLELLKSYANITEETFDAFWEEAQQLEMRARDILVQDSAPVKEAA